jgi:LAO/AO transport system kinase
MLEERLHDLFYRHPAVQQLLPEVERQVMDGSLPATRAAWQLLERFER